MAFDAASARPEGGGEFDAASARPLTAPEQVSPLQAGLISAGHFIDKTAVGLRDALPSTIRNAIDALGSAMGMAPAPTDASLASSEQAIAPVQRAHPVADFVGEAAPQLGTGPGGMGLLAALQPGTALQRGERGALAFGLGKGGEILGNKLAQAASAAGSAAPALTPAEQLLAKTQAAGLKVAPNEAGQQSALQWLGGQIKTQQTMASKNVNRVTELAATDVGLPPGPITREALDGVRVQAGKAYDAVANAGAIPTDGPMQAVANGIETAYNRLTQSFKSLKSPGIETLIADLKSPSFDSQGLVEAVKRFRSEGFANIASPEPAKKALGRVQLQAQEALDGLADRYLTAQGAPDAVARLQQARQLIAKTYSVQNALNPTGNVVAAKLANQMTRGKPLSGNLELLAQAQAAFPKSLQNFSATPPAFSPLDFATALLTHGGKEALMLGVRPLARAVAASGPYQAAFINPGTQIAAPMLSALGNSPALPYAGTAFGLLGQGLGQ